MNEYLMQKEVLTPFTDQFLPTPFNVRVTEFKLGPLYIQILLKDNSRIPEHIQENLEVLEDHRTGMKFNPKKYMLLCIVNDTEPYVLGNFDDKREAWKSTANIIQNLKYGEQIILEDLLHISTPLRLSYKGIDWIW